MSALGQKLPRRGQEIATPAHGADETMLGEDVAVDLGSVLRTAIRVVNAAFRRLPYSESRLQRRNGKAGIDQRLIA